jgi:hypothetical protein
MFKTKMTLSFVIVSLAIGIVASTREICQSQSHKFEYGLEKNDSRFSLHQCENVIKIANRKIDYLKYSSIVYGLLESVENQDVSVTCAEDSQRIIAGVRQRKTWAFKGSLEIIK